MIARTQVEHEIINSVCYPGTRQICVLCEEPTGRCEDDSISLEDETGPICPDCYHESEEYKREDI